LVGYSVDRVVVPGTGPVGRSVVVPVDTSELVTYTIQALVVSLGGPVTQDEGLLVTLSAAGSSDPTGGVLSYAWDLDGDGVFDDGSGVEVSVPVPLVGSYVVAVRVSDALGRFVVQSWTVDARNVVPVVFAGPEVHMSVGGRLSREGTFTDPGADSWEAWVDYGDGSGVVPLVLVGKTFVLDHVYAVAGAYTVTVEVKDVKGGSAGRGTVVVNVVEVPVVEPLASPPPEETPPPVVTPAAQPATGVSPWTGWITLTALLTTTLGILLTHTRHRKHQA
jgi:hypothetical protein